MERIGTHSVDDDPAKGFDVGDRFQHQAAHEMVQRV